MRGGRGFKLRNGVNCVRVANLDIDLQSKQIFKEPELLAALEESPCLGCVLFQIDGHGKLLTEQREHESRGLMLAAIQSIGGSQDREDQPHSATIFGGGEDLV